MQNPEILGPGFIVENRSLSNVYRITNIRIKGHNTIADWEVVSGAGQGEFFKDHECPLVHFKTNHFVLVKTPGYDKSFKDFL